MVIKLSKDASKQVIEEARQKIKAKKKQNNKLSNHFGSLKRGIDGLEYQKIVRDEWA